MNNLAQANIVQPQPAQTPPAQMLPQASGSGLDPQMQAQIKAQMADIIEPSAIGLWPLAWGWWLLIAVTVLIIVLAVGAYIQHRRRNRYRRHALALLSKQAFDNRQQQGVFLMRLIKKVALVAYPKDRVNIAKASGEQWLHWLNSTTRSPLFANATAQQWQQELYAPPNLAEPDSSLTQSVKDWIKKHNRKLPLESHNV